MAARVDAAVQFERLHGSTIQDFDFQRGDLVLVRNTAIEKSLNRKMRARYNGPLLVLSRNKGGTYIICELNSAVFDRPIAAFRVIPYFARKSISLPPLDDFLDISMECLRTMEASTFADNDEETDRIAGPEFDNDELQNPDTYSDEDDIGNDFN